MILLASLILTSQVASAPPIPPVVGPSTKWRPAAVERALEQVARPPQPLYPVQSVVSPYDYPAGASGKGKVVINLSVDKQGHTVGCRIIQSGGSPLLDSGTCALLTRRARFTPAVDRNGNPSYGEIVVQVDWGAVLSKGRPGRTR